ncbi:MAG: class I SAM-dependent methyltransferase, partial [Phycisphaerae bacterium]|nr:class I SAM-dependent methyltransferase [Phycisphaerae bacterium]
MTYDTNTKTSLCPVCRQGPMTEFYSRQNVPVHMHTLFSTQKDATDIDRGSIVLAFCQFCGFVSNIDFDLSKMHYDSTYDNSQTYSETYVKYMDELANQLLFQKGIQNSTIVEVGCGSGFFLRKLVENKNVSNTGIGFDPAYHGPETELDGRLRFERKFYDQRSSHTKADVVICRHVIEHVPDPFELLM